MNNNPNNNLFARNSDFSNTSFKLVIFGLLSLILMSVFAVAYAKTKSKSKLDHKKASKPCIFMQKELTGSGTQGDPYQIPYPESCGSIALNYTGVGLRQYFIITGLGIGKHYTLKMQRRQGKSKAMFSPTHGSLGGISSSSISMSIANAFSSNVQSDKNGHFGYSLLISEVTMYSIMLDARSSAKGGLIVR